MTLVSRSRRPTPAATPRSTNSRPSSAAAADKPRRGIGSNESRRRTTQNKCISAGAAATAVGPGRWPLLLDGSQGGGKSATSATAPWGRRRQLWDVARAGRTPLSVVPDYEPERQLTPARQLRCTAAPTRSPLGVGGAPVGVVPKLPVDLVVYGRELTAWGGQLPAKSAASPTAAGTYGPIAAGIGR